MKEHIISLDDTLEPPKTVHHLLTVEYENCEYEFQVDETIYDFLNSDFVFSDSELADWISEEIGYENVDDFLSACVDIIQENGES